MNRTSMAGEIKVGPGVETLPAAGHKRREVLKKRTANLEKVADKMLSATDQRAYAIDPEKLKEIPEILQHYDPSSQTFKVSKAVKGKVYFWCRDDRNAIAQKQSEANMWLGGGHRGWQMVNELSESMPECPELKAVDGRRMIGDVCLMRIDLNEYILIQKRILLVSRYREANIAQKLSDFVMENEGLVKVIEGKDDPRILYARENPGAGTLVHTGRAPIVRAGMLDD